VTLADCHRGWVVWVRRGLGLGRWARQAGGMCVQEELDRWPGVSLAGKSGLAAEERVHASGVQPRANAAATEKEMEKKGKRHKARHLRVLVDAETGAKVHRARHTRAECRQSCPQWSQCTPGGIS
jgi:hypothetical protein